jgi:hypothetical protein
VIHREEGVFNGAEASGGGFRPAIADATDNSSGPSAEDIYIGTFTRIGKLNPDGTYAGVEINGAETPQGSFSLVSESSVAGAITVDGSSGPNSGDLYVTDLEHGVVDKFSEAGKFICQIAGAETAKEIKEKVEKEIGEGIKVEAPPEECDLAGSGLAGSLEPAGLAVDPSSGDLWVSDRAHEAVDEFNAAGKYVGQIKDSHIVSPGPIALDATGDLYVTNRTTFRGSSAGNSVVVFHEGKFERVLDEHQPLSVAVDRGDGHVYVFEVERRAVAEYDATGTLIDTFIQAVAGTPNMESLAVSSDGHVYGVELFVGVVKYGPGIVTPTVTTGPATGVTEAGATLNGHVEPDVAHGGGAVSVCAFEYVTQQAFETSGFEGASRAACVPAPPFSSPQDVTAAVTLLPSTTYEVRLSASSSNEVPGIGGVVPIVTTGPPIITGEKASALSSDTVSLKATLDASGFEADCRVEYVDEASFQAAGFARAATIPCTPSEVAANNTEAGVSAVANGLALNTTYHYRFVSSNSSGTTRGADQTFATFGIQAFSFEVLDKEGHPDTRAGGHPYEWATSFKLNSTPHSVGGNPEAKVADGNLRNVEAELPPGLIASGTATPRCTRYLMAIDQCSPETQVGVIGVEIVSAEASQESETITRGVYNLVPPKGVPVELGADVQHIGLVYIDGNVRTGGDYGATAKVLSASTAANILGSHLAIWGVPADPSHNGQRVCPAPGEEAVPGERECPPQGPRLPFLTNPTSCPGTPLSASIRVDSWQKPGVVAAATTRIPATTGCEALDFTPSLSISPDTSVADAPSGLNVHLEVPQNETPSGLATSALKNTTVVLPAGVSASPSAANGLQACSEAQIGLHDAEEPQCPNASKIGTVEITSPLITDHLRGGVYVARQGENPFHSLLAMYVAAEADGARVKLAGHIVADPVTGQLTTTFDETPPLPFSDFKLNLFGGRRGALATPETCGSPSTNASLAPWDGLAATSFSEPFTTSTGCVSGFAPSFKAGTLSAQAGAYSPFTLSFSRNDSEEDLAGATVTLPPGLIGKIAGVAQCSDPQLAAAAANSGAAEQASSSCPAASQIGTVQTAAGPGPSPVSVSGKAYLTGSYKGGPYGVAVVVPALAGPYDLGTVVIRQSLHIDPTDAHVTDISDPFPTILQGVPLRLKSVDVTLDRPEFTLNPTSCNPMSIAATLTSTGHAGARVSSRFQAAGCAALQFAPKFSVSTNARTSKALGASLTTKIAEPAGALGSQANISKVKVELPLQLPSQLKTLQKACLDRVFNTNPASCPAESIVGHATVHTPLLPAPLTGPAYFVSHGNEAFPSLTMVLQGNGVTVQLVGSTFIKNGITSSTFKTVPDTPFETFELTLPQGKYAALAANLPSKANGSFCGQNLKMPTELVAQNGAVIHQQTPITVTGCPKAKTAAQLYAAALKACKKKHNKAKRQACARQARRKYGPVKKKKSK